MNDREAKRMIGELQRIGNGLMWVAAALTAQTYFAASRDSAQNVTEVLDLAGDVYLLFRDSGYVNE